MSIFAIIPAGGKGVRSGFALPKQYLKVHGKELIAYTLEIFQKNRSVDDITVSADPYYFDLLKNIKRKYFLTKLNRIVEGGKEIQDSVYNALNSLPASSGDIVLVHDAARPLLPDIVLSHAISGAQEKENAVVCIKAKDTLIRGNAIVEKYLDREHVFYVQTPQAFSYSILVKAFSKAYQDKFYGTDESILVRRLRKKINVVEGSVFNFKVTSQEDFDLFTKLLGHTC
jgi:2-C-methyl-D-erythritol 4-phosphate cytidylyltransferase